MQPENKSKSRGKAVLILFLVLILAGGALWGGINLFRGSSASGAAVSLLPCPYSDSVRPFGKYILYYDGLSLHCINDTGSVRWSFQFGSEGGFDCDGETIAAWSGPNLFIIDKNGKATYNDNLGDEIQFARVGSTYVAAVVGDPSSSRLLVKDHNGNHMDEESDAYNALILLDVGFFGSSGQYMWTMALDVFGTAANTILNTFEVGKMNTGEASLGEPITYKVLYENSLLRLINTRKIRTFSERGTEDASAAILVYGWHYLDSEIPARGSTTMLFAPTSQASSTYDIRELRTIAGSADNRYTLPDSCVGAAVWNKSIYAVSADTLYRVSQNESHFTAYPLAVDGAITRVLGKLETGRLIVAAGDSVYTVTLPQNTYSFK